MSCLLCDLIRKKKLEDISIIDLLENAEEGSMFEICEKCLNEVKRALGEEVNYII